MADLLSFATSILQHTMVRRSPAAARAPQEELFLRAQHDWPRVLRTATQLVFGKPPRAVPHQALPCRRLSRAELLAAPDNTLVRLGHSTVLMKLRGQFWLTDPMLSDRASPCPFAGPRRFQASPIAADELPPLKGVILSHDHYDHLDYATIRAIAERVEHFVTPLGVGDRLIRWGVPAAKIRQLDWWQATAIDGVRLVATPARHFSGRSLFDTNRTLWCSWAILAGDTRVFFSGDTGYFDGMRLIGERLGPFDIALLETGAYHAHWARVHMYPEETLQACLDLCGKTLLPIHNATFDLALHAWDEPLVRINALAQAHGVPLATPRLGNIITIGVGTPNDRWWQATDTHTLAEPAFAC